MLINDIDDNVNNDNENCSEAIYSEQFFDYLVRYNGNLSVFSEIFGEDICVNRINGQYAVVYKHFFGDIDTEAIVKPGFGYIPKCYGLMDVYADEGSGVEALTTLPGLALSGDGVIIGFLDTGIDSKLNMFRSETGESRIICIWDQNDNSSIDVDISSEKLGYKSGHFGFGNLYTSENLAYAPGDENGHGTFLASVAAGRGVGIAKKASLAVVKLKSAKENLRRFYCVPSGVPCYSETDIMLGVRFLVEVAAREGKPLVICLGLGTNQGAHQGKSLLEKYLSYMASYRGVCVVSAVGNELLADTHYHGLGNTANTPVEISVDESFTSFSMELWSNPLIYLDIRLVSPTGEIFSGVNARRDGYYRKQFVYEGTVVEIVNVAIDVNVGVQMMYLRFEGASGGIWKLYVTESESSRGEGYDSWLPLRQYTGEKVRFVDPDPAVTICAPGSAEGVITAAAYNVANDTIYAYSSRGFNRQGIIKPDIAASGVAVIGAFAGSGSSSEDLLTTRSGSSVASAVLAGMAALVLEWGLVKGNAPYISTEEIKQLFIQGAARKDYLTYPDTSFGWGEVDILNSFNRLRL